MYALHVSLEYNGYLRKHTEIKYIIQEYDTDAEVLEMLGGYCSEDDAKEHIAAVNSGQLTKIRSTGGAANTRISCEGWVILTNNFQELPEITLEVDGLEHLGIPAGCEEATDGIID